MKTHEGSLVYQGGRVAIICSRFNAFIVESLLNGAKDGLKRHGMPEENIEIAWAPGAYELPLLADRFLASEKVDAVIALGAVIRGATAHFDLVASDSSKGLSQVSLKYGKPVINAVLTTESIEQAIERAGTKAGNKGFDAAMAAIEMINLLDEI